MRQGYVEVRREIEIKRAGLTSEIFFVRDCGRGGRPEARTPEFARVRGGSIYPCPGLSRSEKRTPCISLADDDDAWE